MTRALSLALVWACCFNGTLRLAWDPVTTQCDGTPETMGTYEITLRKCSGDTLRLAPIPAQFTQADVEILDGSVGVAELRAIDAHGNRSCGYQSITFAFPATEAPPPDTTSGGIAPHFYVGTSRGGQAIIGPASNIDFVWALGSPISGIPADGWSADWSGTLTVPTTGAYTFYLKSEDGGQLFVGGTLGINHYGIQALTEWTWTTNLTAGDKPITVTYMANVGNSECHLMWSGPGIVKQPIPKGALR